MDDIQRTCLQCRRDICDCTARQLDNQEHNLRVLHERIAELKREVERWKSRAEMACQCAPDNCDCEGCLLAAERNRG
jgi:hypothetical protein